MSRPEAAISRGCERPRHHGRARDGTVEACVIASRGRDIVGRAAPSQLRQDIVGRVCAIVWFRALPRAVVASSRARYLDQNTAEPEERTLVGW